MAPSVVSAMAVMLDVGAHVGASLHLFDLSGWTIHAFEPDPANRAVLEAGYGGHPNVGSCRARLVPSQHRSRSTRAMSRAACLLSCPSRRAT